MTPAPPARLTILFAPDAPVAVVYRYGPSKWTQMWLWNTEDDTFTPGQWIKGRVQEDSTLSPDGRYVISRVMRGDQHTVISRPPYFSALAVNVRALCCDGSHFLASGEIAGDLGRFHAPRERCPFKDSIVRESWFRSDVVDNHVLLSRGPMTGPDQKGRTIVVAEGRIGVDEHGETRWLIDLNPFRPEDVQAPAWALEW